MDSDQRIQQIQSINKLIHEPVRLGIMTVLCSAKEADFNFLLTALGVTKGNLSTHIARLVDAGYVTVKKDFRGKIPHTSYRVTRPGRDQFTKYWGNMNGLAPGQE